MVSKLFQGHVTPLVCLCLRRLLNGPGSQILAGFPHCPAPSTQNQGAAAELGEGGDDEAHFGSMVADVRPPLF